jgi:1-acyl-sn-glycerol-3-phosphate acyltransferase
LAVFLSLTGVLLPVAMIAYPAGPGAVRRVAMIWFRGVARLTNLRVTVNGSPAQAPGTLYICNHVSYLDIPVLAMLQDAAFVAKDDVAGWPLFGLCAKIYRTVFIRRDPREALNQRKEMAARLAAGDSLMLFPEGTSSDGKRVLPFKSALFAVAEGSSDTEQPFVQPVSIAYTRYADGRPLDSGLQALYAWYGEMTLLPHLVSVFGLRGAMVEVTFHAPVQARDFANRKALAGHCFEQVSQGVTRAHRRRVYDIPMESGKLVEFRA